MVYTSGVRIIKQPKILNFLLSFKCIVKYENYLVFNHFLQVCRCFIFLYK